VAFPVVPMLDMAFQLLAFFILTFQPPSRETRIDLDLPVAPVALPRGPAGRASSTLHADELGLETDLVVRAAAGARGELRSLRLGEAVLEGARDLEDRLRRYRNVLRGEPLRVELIADEMLRYEEAARLVGACAAAGVTTIRLAEPRDDAQPGRGGRSR
jgi:biopolymer transport protein ExbD